MNTLTIPALSGGASHLIPLYVLHQRYFRKLNVNNHFLVLEGKHETLKKSGIPVVPIDYNLQIQSKDEDLSIHKDVLFKKQRDAYKHVQPTVIIEDNSFSTPLIAEKNNIPRISIHRTGFFRSLPKEYRNPNHMHSLEKGYKNEKSFDASFIFNSDFPSLKTNRSEVNLLRNYLNAKTKLIPGIPSIEVLPENIKNRDSYFYTGPLTVEDNPSEALKNELDTFMNANADKKKVFITTGLIDRGNISEYVAHLLNQNYAVIATAPIEVNETYQNQFFYNRFLPLNFICTKVDLVIHQCGSGMYHYPILNEKPSITIGTQCYDREDVAIRLQQLGVNKHVPHPDDNAKYLAIFKEAVQQFQNNTLCDFDQLKKLKEEIYNTMLSFDIEEVIRYTLN